MGITPDALVERAMAPGDAGSRRLNEPVDLESLQELAKNEAARLRSRNRETGLRRLERVLAEIGWERRGRRWVPSNCLGLGTLHFGQSEIVVLDDDDAHVFADALKVAPYVRTILLRGEPGTGKNDFALACHEASGRQAPCVSANAASLRPAYAEAELFGVEDGAITDVKGRKGLFDEANRGTLFLDEIGELPLEVQAALLRALDPGMVRAIGANKERRVDVLVVAATNQNLEEAVVARTFRADLLSRLSTPTVELRPIRGRHHAILSLATHFLEKSASRSKRNVALSAAALVALLLHTWPGNARGLAKCVEQAAARADNGCIQVEDLGLRSSDASTRRGR
jgi:two-component system response regulator AtoC